MARSTENRVLIDKSLLSDLIEKNKVKPCDLSAQICREPAYISHIKQNGYCDAYAYDALVKILGCEFKKGTRIVEGTTTTVNNLSIDTSDIVTELRALHTAIDKNNECQDRVIKFLDAIYDELIKFNS